MSYHLPFTWKEACDAVEEWGCNCGPGALAFALQKPLVAARYAIPDFDRKHYTSPTMMAAALDHHKQGFTRVKLKRPDPGKPADVEPLFQERIALVRVQWCGPWTKPGMNPRWAYAHTHWISTWSEHGVPLVFDINAGISGFSHWCDCTANALMEMDKSRDGNWFPTHCWRLAVAA